jgi:hypothetical protein
MTNSAMSKLNLFHTLRDVFAKVDAQNAATGNNVSPQKDKYMQCYDAAESILLGSRKANGRADLVRDVRP